ncbi:hypothetical protein H9P43_007803 [Blastocladiella emersonii ATCC 22665]|nr:hypothetical protein H9P43_007803 [Blastocladiella emersonii ATCC 22665]
MVHNPVVGAYYCSWTVYDPRAYTPDQIPVEKLTHLYYAFANISAEGVIVPGDQWADVDKPYTARNGTQLRGAFQVLNHPQGPLRQRNPNFRSVISIGGWTMSKEFSNVARTPESRAKFTKSVVDFVALHGFDGIDIDWEFPVEGGLPANSRCPQDGQNLTLLCESLHRALAQLAQQTGRRSPYCISAAVPHAEWLYRHFDLAGLAKYCDHLLVMTYDATGAWSKVTGHHAPVSCIQTAVQGYTQRGVPAAKLLAGLPQSGRAFGGVKSPAVGSPLTPGTGPGTHAKGIVDWDDLRINYTPAKGYTASFDAAAGVPILYNANAGVWVTAENEQSIAFKSETSRKLGLGGVFFWELSQDKTGMLVSAARRALGMP